MYLFIFHIFVNMFFLPFDIVVSNLLLDRNVISTKLVTNFAEDLKMLLLSYNNKNTFSLLTYYQINISKKGKIFLTQFEIFPNGAIM